MDVDSILLLLLIILFVCVNAFFVACEFALMKVHGARIKELMENGSAHATVAHRVIKKLDVYLSVTQAGVALATLALGWLGVPFLEARLIAPLFRAFHWQESDAAFTGVALLLAFMLLAILHGIFGRQVPKWLALQRAEVTVLRVALPLTFCYWLFRPFMALLNGASLLLLAPFGIRHGIGAKSSHSEEELRQLITASGAENGGGLRETQAELLDNVFAFGTRLARQVMIHRTEILMLDIEDTLEENIHLAQQGAHTRFPVYQSDIDTVIGFVHTKDLFALYQRDPQADMRTIVRQILTVPETIRVDMLLRQMQRERQHLAILVDEYGGTAGLVTVTDLLEELVGEMPDEFEPAEEAWAIELGDACWSVDGRVPLSDLEELLAHKLDCEESCDTVGGFAYWAFGRIPQVDDKIELPHLSIHVLSMDGRRVSRLKVCWHDTADDALEIADLSRTPRVG